MPSHQRHHASLVVTVSIGGRDVEYLYVMGGRARELVDYPEEKSIGGIIGQRLNDVPGMSLSTQVIRS